MNQQYANLYAVLAMCFQHPDDQFIETVEDGTLAATVDEYARRLGLTAVESPPEFEGSPQEAYLRTFEGFEGGGYAPPAESVYRPWWDGTDRGILSGPPAHDMERRYEAVDIETPAAYPADHVALELEYASLLLDYGADEEYVAFAETRLDWVPEFRERIERTSDVEFYVWAARTLETVVERTLVVLEGGDTFDEQ